VKSYFADFIRDTKVLKDAFFRISGLNKLLFLSIFAFLLILIPFTVNNNQKTQQHATEGAEIGVQLTSGFPTFPVYPNAMLISSSKSTIQNAGMSYKSSWSVTSSVPTTVKWYMDDLKSSGWTIEIPPANFAAEDIQFLQASKEGLLPAQLSVIKKDNYTEVTAEFIPIKPEQEGK